MSACRSCGAELLWAFTATGSRMPLNAEPSDAGNVVLSVGPTGQREATVIVEGDPRGDSQALYIPHHAVCPDGKKWRRK